MTTVVDPRAAMLSAMSQCAYRLGMAFGAESERAQDAARRLEYFHLFDRCFFAVRMATALELRLVRMPTRSEREPLGDREDLRDREDLADRERPEREGPEREREREREPASLPLLLKVLDGVAADAAALPGPAPAELPTLRELLARIRSQPSPVSAAPSATLRARLAGSVTATALKPAPSAPSVRTVALAMRRATGPPRR